MKITPKILPNAFTNALRVFKPLFFILLICGFNLIYNRNIYVKIGTRAYSVLLILIISYANMTCCPSQELAFIWPLLEYVVYVIFMMFYDSRLLVYIGQVVDVDNYLRVNGRNYCRMRLKLYIVILVMFIIRTFYMTIFCSVHFCYTSLCLFIIFQFSRLALDITRVWRYCLFEMIWQRLRLLSRRLEENPSENHLYINNNKMMKENKIKMGLLLYRKIADLLDLISPELNASLFMGIVCSLPRLIIIVYRILVVIDSGGQYESLGIMSFNIFQTTIFIVAPCIVIELFRSEVEKIRLFLMHNYIHETDPDLKADIHVFLEYTHVRDFSYTVWRIIPMNMQLPLHLINFCTTYVIVVANFTDVFG